MARKRSNVAQTLRPSFPLSTLGSKESSKLKVTAWAAATRLNFAKEFDGANVWTVIIMRHFAFPLFVATCNEAGHGQDRGLKKIIPARVVLSAGPDEPSLLIEAHAASQSIASTAATHRASKGGDNISASLILLALRRHQYETQRNNARL